MILERSLAAFFKNHARIGRENERRGTTNNDQ